MSEDADAVTVVGRSVDAAVEAVVDADPSRDPEAVRAVLDGVVDDGVVTSEAVEGKVGETSLVVATAENRTEFARMALDDAREAVAAEGVGDVDVVRARLDRFETALAGVEDDLDALGDDLGNAVDGLDGAATYPALRALREVDRDARAVQLTADELKVDVEAFERQVRAPATWVEELDGDVDALDAAVGDLETAADAVADGAGGVDDHGDTWADARLRAAAYDLLLADLRAELAALRAWPGDSPEGVEAVASRLTDLADRLTAARERLGDGTRPEWRERHGDRIEEFERELVDRDPPVGWGEVEAELAARREALGAASDG